MAINGTNEYGGVRILFDIIDEYLFIVDESGSIIDANKAAVKRLGYSMNELKGLHIQMRIVFGAMILKANHPAADR